MLEFEGTDDTPDEPRIEHANEEPAIALLRNIVQFEEWNHTPHRLENGKVKRQSRLDIIKGSIVPLIPETRLVHLVLDTKIIQDKILALKILHLMTQNGYLGRHESGGGVTWYFRLKTEIPNMPG